MLVLSLINCKRQGSYHFPIHSRHHIGWQ